MNAPDLLKSYDNDLRINIQYPEARKETTDDVVRFIRKPPGMNFVVFTFAGEPDLDRVIDEQLEYFLPLGQPFTWKLYEHDRAGGMKDRLTARGFVYEDEDPGQVMLLRVDQAPAHLLGQVTADVRRITSTDGLKDVVHVLDTVYGNQNGWVYDRLGGHLQVPGYLSVYAAYVKDQPAAVAWTYFPQGQFATLFAGSTIAGYRRQGLYTALLATRLQEIRARGVGYAVVDAGSMSRPIVAKHGFEYLTTQYDYVYRG